MMIVEVVGDAARELTDRFHLLGHGKLLARLDQFFLRVAPLRCVPEDIGETDQRSVLVPDGRDRAGDEHQRTVLFDAPALDFVFAFLGGAFERSVRLAGAALVRPINDAEMLAENFVSGVPGDLLGRTVPACDMAAGVDDKNEVVVDSFNQNLEQAPRAFERHTNLRDFIVCFSQIGVQALVSLSKAGDHGAEDQRGESPADRKRK